MKVQRLSTLALAMAALAGCAPRSTAQLPASPIYLSVGMQEYRFDFTKPVSPGRVIFRAKNAGKIKHQLRLVGLPESLPPLDVQLRSPTAEHVVVDTLSILPTLGPGEKTMFAADLHPGRYGLICFLEDPGGTSHALKGMTSEFRIPGRVA